MPMQVMRRSASDNAYLHKDFHGALSCGIEYLHTHYGEAAVQDYLRDFARAFYAPLRSRVQAEGLAAIRQHYENVFQTEGASLECAGNEHELTLTVRACPAIRHMRQRNLPVARLFCETTRVVNVMLCEGTPFTATLCDCDPERGCCVQKFRRRS